jgi:anti-sigma factor RsiW
VSAATPPDGHPVEDLSALLDGDLAPERRDAVESHLQGCASCRAELAELDVVRRVLRTLPFVEPPRGFYERTMRQGPRPRRTASLRFGQSVIISIIGLAAVLLVVAVVARRQPDVDPSVAAAMADYSEVADRPAVPAQQLAPPADDSLPEGVPRALALGFVLESVGTGPGTEVVYADESRRRLLLRCADGELDTGELDRAAVPVEVGDDPAWHVVNGGTGVLAVQRGERTYVLAGELSRDELVVVAASLPSSSGATSAGEQVQAAGRALLEAFGFGG